MDSLTGAKTTSGGTDRSSTANRGLESFLSRWTGLIQSSFNLRALFAIYLFILCASTAFVGAVPTRIYGHDDFFLLDNGWRIVNGQRPHIDFFSPWGPVTFLVVGMGLALSDASVNGIGYGNAIVGLFIGLWAFRISHGRLAPAFRLILVIYLTLLVTAPYPLGVWPLLSSHAMLYNRYGYALLGLLLVECLQNKGGEEQDTGTMPGSISTGAIVAITFFLKANFFAISLLLITASFFFRQLRFRRVIGLVIGFCPVFLIMLAYLKFDIRAIVESFWMAAGARSNALHSSMITSQLISQLPTLLIVIALMIEMAFVFSSRRPVKSVESWLDTRQWLIWAFLIFASDSLLMFSNMQSLAMPLLGIFAIVFVNRLIAELQQSRFASVQIDPPRYMVVFILCAILAATRPAADLVGLVYGVYQKAHASKRTGVVRFTEPHLASMLLLDGDSMKSDNGSVYTNYVNDGIALLRKHCNAGDRVLNMDHVNPFPYAMKWKPPIGGIAAISFNYTLSAKFRPSFDAFFGNASVVMMPKHPSHAPFYIDGFHALFKPALLDRYQLNAESDWFWLYKQK